MAEKRTPLNTKEAPVDRRAIQNGLIESRGGNSEDPFGYAGPGIYPSAEGDALMGRVAEARARAIYEAHGRNANAIARMKLDPSYAYATAAGIQLPGHGMVNTYNTQTGGLVGNPGAGSRPAGSGGANPAADRALRNSISYRDAGAAMRGAGDAKPIVEGVYAGPNANNTTKGPRLDTQKGSGSQTLDSLPVTQPTGEGDKPKPPAPMADPTSPPPPTPAQPEGQRTPTVEGTTKGPRLTTNRSQPSRDEDLGTTRGATRDEDARIAEIAMSPDANLPYDGKEGPGSNQERREAAKKDYDSRVQSEARKDPFAKYRTEAGDTEISQRTGEVQDRSRYGGDRVVDRKTYTNKNGREMVGNTMQRPDGSTYFVGLDSADQNKANTFNENTKGGSFNQYNNYAQKPKDYKASAEDIRANYSFGAPAGQQGRLTASPDDALGRGNRKQLDADTAKASAGSNYSGIDSRGQQSPSLTAQSKRPINENETNPVQASTFAGTGANPINPDPGAIGGGGRSFSAEATMPFAMNENTKAPSKYKGPETTSDVSGPGATSGNQTTESKEKAKEGNRQAAKKSGERLNFA